MVTSNADTSPTAAHPASPDSPASTESPTAAHPASPDSPATTESPTSQSAENSAVTIDPDAFIPGQMNLQVESRVSPVATCGTERRPIATSCVSTESSAIRISTNYMIGEEAARDVIEISCRLITPDTWCVSAEIATHAGDTTTFEWSCQSVDSPVRFGEDPTTGKGAIDIQVTRVILPPE